MYHGRHARGHYHSLGVLSAVAAVLAVVVAAALIGRISVSQRGAEDASRGTAAGHARSVLAECRSMWRAQSSVLRTAAPAISQWEVHVDAMNQLVAGKISLAQATAFWARTRVGAAHRVATFRSTDAGYLAGSPRCETGRLPASAASPAVASCARSVNGREDVLARARTAIDTWHKHIEAMEMLRMGQMSPAQATRMWLKMWRMGSRQIDGYHAAVRQTRDGGSCAG